ncbi:hypothetical protein LPTSP4_18280 [Leptospira ryugenii]|uniref:Uncharacterized protein n=1 Tax=Leptospira ryugenii TaxID=1917863 RepID=A0A2P2E094_9LEPT|nr:hypothetical protein [Leptospira ryugenii]GBF50303.1 hypothetical protein LPTSP4_18280 [Leptospira ryugenii]
MKQIWRKQKPRTPGFIRSFTMETPLGDVLEAEFNFHERLVRLSAEIKAERGRIYNSTIRNGVVMQEKDMTAGRVYPVFRKIWPFREFFSLLPDKDMLASIGGCYEIYPPQAENQSERKSWEEKGFGEPFSTKYDSIFGIIRETRFQRWRRKRREARLSRGTRWERFKRRFWGDVQDICLGLGLCGVVYYAYYDYVILGFSLASFGMLAGLLDFLVRKRSVLMTKVLSFLSLGSYFFYTGYVYF